METRQIEGKTITEWKEAYPLLNELIAVQETFWTNPKYGTFQTAIERLPLTEKDVKEAEERLTRFAPYIAKVFPETKGMCGIIESPVTAIPSMHQQLEKMYEQALEGTLLLKCDSHLPISEGPLVLQAN